MRLKLVLIGLLEPQIGLDMSIWDSNWPSWVHGNLRMRLNGPNESQISYHGCPGASKQLWCVSRSLKFTIVGPQVSQISPDRSPGASNRPWQVHMRLKLTIMSPRNLIWVSNQLSLVSRSLKFTIVCPYENQISPEVKTLYAQFFMREPL